MHFQGARRPLPHFFPFGQWLLPDVFRILTPVEGANHELHFERLNRLAQHTRHSLLLSWQVSSASYIILSPQVGPVRGTSVTVTPTQTTTYTLAATNAFDRSTLSLTVIVQ